MLVKKDCWALAPFCGLRATGGVQHQQHQQLETTATHCSQPKKLHPPNLQAEQLASFTTLLIKEGFKRLPAEEQQRQVRTAALMHTAVWRLLAAGCLFELWALHSSSSAHSGL